MSDSQHYPRKGGEDSLASSFATTYAGVIAFFAVAHEGSFARAGDRLGIGRSAVSRSVQKLETQLDVRLFMRTTRRTSLTCEGELFYENCHPGVERILQSLEEIRELRSGPPRGHLRICSTTGFGRAVIGPLLPGFSDTYPDITVELLLSDQPVNFAADRVDVSFLDGRMEDSQMIAKQLFPMQLIVCASPDYALAHGLPSHVSELMTHRCISIRSATGRIVEWEFNVDDRLHKVMPGGRQIFNCPELALQAVHAGQGVAQLAAYHVYDALRDGRLLACLSPYAPTGRGHYLCYLSRKHLPSRVRVFVDYVTEQVRGLDFSFLAVDHSTNKPTAPLQSR
jgi:LysR family transcriptional regulator for bpeEF and oprC